MTIHLDDKRVGTNDQILATATHYMNEFFLAKNLMTDAVKVRLFADDTPVERVEQYLSQHNFDIALVGGMHDALGYAVETDIREATNTEIGPFKQSISPEQTVGPKANAIEVLQRFAEYRYVFVFDHQHKFSGLITYADLNKPPLYVLCFIAVSELERLLRQAVEIQFGGSVWLKRLSAGSHRDIGAVYIDAKANGVETTLLECTTITHLKEILMGDGSWIREVGYGSRDAFKRSMDRIIGWRNTVVHSRAMVRSSEGGNNLHKIVNELGTQVQQLRKWLQKPIASLVRNGDYQ